MWGLHETGPRVQVFVQMFVQRRMTLAGASDWPQAGRTTLELGGPRCGVPGARDRTAGGSREM